MAGRVWWYPADPDPANVQGGVAVVADERGSVVVDAGNSPAHARLIQAAMAEAGLPAARWLVYTHHHWDHVWGACAWADVEIVGHAAGRALLEAEAARPWSHGYLREQVAADPRLGPSFRVPDSSVMLLGDSIYPPPVHLRRPGDGLDLALARELLEEGYECYVDGHGEPWRRDEPPDLD